jgi:biopolymer transport protein ExbD
MIDTIFFLLVFFMMSTLSMVKLNGLIMSLPKDSLASPGATPNRVAVAIAPNGDILVDKRKTDIRSLPATFRAALNRNKTAVVVLSVASTQKTQTLVSTMDVLDEIMTEAGNDRPILIATPKTGLNVPSPDQDEDN